MFSIYDKCMFLLFDYMYMKVLRCLNIVVVKVIEIIELI